MLNYDAFVRLIELHCRRTEALSGHGVGRGASPRPPWSNEMAGAFGDGKAGGAVGGGGGEGVGGSLSKEKAMRVWLLEQPLFAARDLNRYLLENIVPLTKKNND